MRGKKSATSLDKANRLLEKGNHPEARRLYEDHCARNPDDYDSRLVLCRICEAMGDFDQALKGIRLILTKDAGNVDAIVLCASLERKQGNLAAAEKTLLNAVEAAPDNCTLLSQLGIFFQASGRLDEARRWYEKTLLSCTDMPVVHFNLGIIHQQTGQIDQARACYLEAVRLAPDYAMAHANLGFIYRQSGELDKAISSYRHALDISPAMPQIHFNLGLCYKDLDDIDAAINCFDSALNLNPSYIDVYVPLAQCHDSKGDSERAEKILLTAVQNNPASAALHLELGRRYQIAKQYSVAEQHLKKVLGTQLDGVRLRCALGGLYLSIDELVSAVEHTRHALAADADDMQANHLMGILMRRQGRFDDADAHYAAALKASPEDENIIADRCELLELRGEFDKARELIEPLLESSAGNRKLTKVYASICRQTGQVDKAVAVLEGFLEDSGDGSEEYYEIHQELGKLLDSEGEYDKAFQHYQRFNEGQKKRQTDPVRAFTGDAALRMAGRLVTGYDKEFWNDVKSSGVASKRPVFIFGMPRSGTSLTEQILSSHPDVYGAGELMLLPDIVDALADKYKQRGAFPETLRDMDKGEASAFANQYLTGLKMMDADAKKVSDKMPTNFWYLGLIRKLFPSAAFVHISRDPVDTCLSIYFQNFALSMAFTNDLAEIGQYYKAYTRVMRYWKDDIGIELHEIRYEDLVSDTEATVRGLIEHCGLSWDENCLYFNRTARDVNTPSYDQVRRPMYTSSVARWKHYEKHLTDLLAVLHGVESD